MGTPPELSSEQTRARERQRQLDALASKAIHEQADAAVEVTATAGAFAALCGHLGLVLVGAWLLTRGGPVRGFSVWSQIGAGVLMFDAFLCAFLMPTMLRLGLDRKAVRAALIAGAAVVALTALPTVFVSVFGEIAMLPFRHILYAGKGGLWMLALLGIIACYGAASVWLAWRLWVNPGSVLPLLNREDAAS